MLFYFEKRKTQSLKKLSQSNLLENKIISYYSLNYDGRKINKKGKDKK